MSAMNWTILLLIALVVMGIFWVTRRRPNGEPSRRRQELATSRADFSFEIAEELPLSPTFAAYPAIEPSGPLGAISFAVSALNVLPRDPQTLYTYWEFVPGGGEPLAALTAHYGPNMTPVLRLYQLNMPWFAAENVVRRDDQAIDLRSGNWYIHVPYPNTTYCVELGVLLPGGEFIGLLRSREVLTPRDSVSPKLDPNWPPLPGLQFGTGLEDRAGSSLKLLPAADPLKNARRKE